MGKKRGVGDRLEFESRLHGAAKAWPSYFTAHLPNEDHTAHLESLFRKSERNRVKAKAAVGTRGKKKAAVLITILTHLHTSQLLDQALETSTDLASGVVRRLLIW